MKKGPRRKQALDFWREWTARPLNVDFKAESGGWSVLAVGGKEYRFHESASPGLAGAVATLIVAYLAAWNLAQPQLRHVKTRASEGKENASLRWADKDRERAMQYIDGYLAKLAKGQPPYSKAELARLIKYTPRHLRNLAKSLMPAEKKGARIDPVLVIRLALAAMITLWAEKKEMG